MSRTTSIIAPVSAIAETTDHTRTSHMVRPRDMRKSRSLLMTEPPRSQSREGKATGAVECHPIKRAVH